MACADDHWLVERNPVVRTLDPWVHLSQPFWSRWERIDPYWRPVVTGSVALDRALWGLRAWGYHLTNLLIHGLCAVLLFLLLRELASGAAAAAGAALFAVHPLGSEVAVWVMGRTDGLAAALLLTATWLYGRSGARRALIRMAPTRPDAATLQRAFAFPLIWLPEID